MKWQAYWSWAVFLKYLICSFKCIITSAIIIIFFFIVAALPFPKVNFVLQESSKDTLTFTQSMFESWKQLSCLYSMLLFRVHLSGLQKNCVFQNLWGFSFILFIHLLYPDSIVQVGVHMCVSTYVFLLRREGRCLSAAAAYQDQLGGV